MFIKTGFKREKLLSLSASYQGAVDSVVQKVRQQDVCSFDQRHRQCAVQTENQVGPISQVKRNGLVVWKMYVWEHTLASQVRVSACHVWCFCHCSSLALNLRSVTSPEFVRRALLFKESELLRALAARLLSKVQNWLKYCVRRKETTEIR